MRFLYEFNGANSPAEDVIPALLVLAVTLNQSLYLSEPPLFFVCTLIKLGEWINLGMLEVEHF